MPTIKEQKEKRAGLVVNMRALLDKPATKAAGGKLNTEDESSYQNMEKEVDEIGIIVSREEKTTELLKNLRNQRDNNYRPVLGADGKVARVSNRKVLPDGYADALFNGQSSYARVGRNGVSTEYMNVLNEGNDTQGGYLVPEEFETKVIEGLVNLDPIRANATVITTGSDRNIPIETGSGAFTYLGESGDYPTDDPTLGKVVLGAFKSGGIIKVSEELLQDSFFNIESYLQRLSIRRYNTLEQSAFANGTGVAGPLGLFQTTAVGGVNVTGTVGAISATAAVTSDNLVDTYHGLARAYRDSASWITSDTMVKMIRKLKDTVGQYLWQPGLQAGQPDRLLNRPIYVSDGAPVPAIGGASTNGNRSLLLGDWSFYYIADRLGLSVQVLRELYAASGQIGFKFTKRNDGRMTYAPAMTYFQQGPAS